MSLDTKKVKQLIALMNSMTEVKIPPMKPIIECFEIGMDARTLDYLLEVGTEPHTMEQLKAIYARMFAVGQLDYEAGWQDFWAGVYQMSFLLPAEHDHSMYELASIFPGWIEMSVSGPFNAKREAIIAKFMEFWSLLRKLNVGPMRALSNMQGVREARTSVPHMSTLLSTGHRPASASSSHDIQVGAPLTSEQQVLTSGDVYELLARNKDHIAVMNCICRTYKHMTEGAHGDCAHGLPIEACMNIGPLSDQLVANGTSRPVSYEEAVAMVEEFERKGCIHTTFHYGSSAGREAINICNCCNDCCLLYGGYQQGYLSKVFVKSFWAPQMVDEARCVGCDLCGEYCATGATYYDKATGKLVFDYEACVGCGQCVTQCRFDVRRMVPDERGVFAPTKAKAPADARAERKAASKSGKSGKAAGGKPGATVKGGKPGKGAEAGKVAGKAAAACGTTSRAGA